MLIKYYYSLRLSLLSILSLISAQQFNYHTNKTCFSFVKFIEKKNDCKGKYRMPVLIFYQN